MVRDAFGEEASKVVECLLLNGRMKVKDAIWDVRESGRRRRMQSLHDDGGSGNKNGLVDGKDDGEEGG